MPEAISVPMGARRVCNAIAKIGYSPSSSIMDIIDNSVTASASNIFIEIELDPDKTYATKNNVLIYRIIDNGNGMNDDDIFNAFKLGSIPNYGTDSLSKYGMGMKSAGLSLGTRITIISKKNGVFSKINYLDINLIEDDYVIYRDDITDDNMTFFHEKTSNSVSGTIVEISGCERIEQASASSTINNLQERLGVVYREFLARTEAPLNLRIRCSNKPEIVVGAHDILFVTNSLPEFDEGNYDCKTPCLVLNTTLPISEDPNVRPIEIEAVIFPRGQMANYPGFSLEDREAIAGYKIARKNKGFYIYRNGRLIQWGESLEDLVGKDDINFRCRIKLFSEHDDLLHVDVSKQRLAIPEDILGRIELLVRNPLRFSKLARERCTSLLNIQGESEAFNERNQDLVVEDFEEPTGAENVRTARERRRRLVEQTEVQLERDGEPTPEVPAVVEEIPVFQKIRYSERVSSSNLWEAGSNATDGDFVRININHSFYRTVLNALAATCPERQALEALLWTCAAAENKAYTNLPDITPENIERVLARFKRIVGHTLETWCSNNQDLFNND